MDVDYIDKYKFKEIVNKNTNTDYKNMKYKYQILFSNRYCFNIFEEVIEKFKEDVTFNTLFRDKYYNNETVGLIIIFNSKCYFVCYNQNGHWLCNLWTKELDMIIYKVKVVFENILNKYKD